MINLYAAETNILMYVLIFGGFIALMMFTSILPQKKRQKQMKSMMDSLRVGNKIKTIGGFIATIVSIDSDKDEVVINLGTEKDPVYATITRLAVYMNMDAAVKTPATNSLSDAENDKEKEERPSI
jgi:preprotein translocase subunit YajC